MITIQAKLLPLDAIKQAYSFNPEMNKNAGKLARAHRNNLTPEFLLDLIIRISTYLNFIISIKGKPGSGKSYGGGWLTCSILKLLNKKFDEIHLAFTQTETIRKMKIAKQKNLIKRSIFILDEMPRGTQFGLGGKREMSHMADIFDMVRAWNICFILISPEWKEEFPAHFKLEATGEIDTIQNKAKSLLYLEDVEYPIGYIVTGIPPQEYLDIYEGLKDKNIDRVIAGRGTGRIAQLEKKAIQVLSSPLYQQARNRNEKLFVIRRSFDGLTTGEQNQILAVADLVQRNKYMKQIKSTVSKGTANLPVTKIGGVNISTIVQTHKPPEQIRTDLSDDVIKTKLDKLNRREKIKELLNKGYTQRQIAEELGISPPAVSVHVKKIYLERGINLHG